MPPWLWPRASATSPSVVYVFQPSLLTQLLRTDAQLQQTCINNMVSIATSEFGCGQSDVSCQCNKAEFGYGVRDCANEACGGSDAASVIAYGNSYCQSKPTPLQLLA